LTTFIYTKESIMDLGNLVVDPRGAQGDVPHPAVAWEGTEPSEGQWAGTVDRDETPQVELRRQLAYGGHVVVRLSAGDHIEREGKEPVSAGVMLSADRGGAIPFEASEYYSLTFAVAEGFDRLMEEQERFLGEMGDRLTGGGKEPPAPAA
jgi:hypothetical protein